MILFVVRPFDYTHSSDKRKIGWGFRDLTQRTKSKPHTSNAETNPAKASAAAPAYCVTALPAEKLPARVEFMETLFATTGEGVERLPFINGEGVETLYGPNVVDVEFPAPDVEFAEKFAPIPGAGVGKLLDTLGEIGEKVPATAGEGVEKFPAVDDEFVEKLLDTIGEGVETSATKRGEGVKETPELDVEFGEKLPEITGEIVEKFPITMGALVEILGALVGDGEEKLPVAFCEFSATSTPACGDCK